MEYSASSGKKAPLAFLMLFSIHILLEREVDHQAPRHLADWDTGISMLLTTMVDKFLGFEGEITASHLSVLRIRLLAEAKESTAVICCLQSARLVERVRMSSAWDKAPRNRPFILRPHDFDCSSKRIESITRRKSTGDSTDPWRTPRWMANGEEDIPFT